MNDLINDLYQEIILDHGREPRNFGECEPHNKSADGHNPLCGDNLKLTFLLNDQNIIEDIKFTGEGCAISLASASLMTEKLKGKKIEVAEKIFKDFTNLVSGSDEGVEYVRHQHRVLLKKTPLGSLSEVLNPPFRSIYENIYLFLLFSS